MVEGEVFVSLIKGLNNARCNSWVLCSAKPFSVWARVHPSPNNQLLSGSVSKFSGVTATSPCPLHSVAYWRGFLTPLLPNLLCWAFFTPSPQFIVVRVDTAHWSKGTGDEGISFYFSIVFLVPSYLKP
jgi:hypothetical protein